MKNVAGYDISRLMVGALGTLGILLDISCKVLPLPAEEVTLVIEPITLEQALAQMIHWDNQALPLTGSCFDSGKLFLRLSGISIQSARHKIPADSWSEDAHFWKQLREQNLPFFAGDNTPLWRLSVPPTTPPLTLSGETLIEWGGAQRWLRSDLPADTIRATVAAVGGHATLFRGGDRHATVFHPLSPALESLHRRIKEKFDPYNILNPHRMAMKW
jgi:glycolate oxidase FAD binding subunit